MFLLTRCAHAFFEPYLAAERGYVGRNPLHKHRHVQGGGIDSKTGRPLRTLMCPYLSDKLYTPTRCPRPFARMAGSVRVHPDAVPPAAHSSRSSRATILRVPLQSQAFAVAAA